MSKAKPIDTPVIKNHGLSLNDCPKTPANKAKMASVPYASAIGSLMYAMVCTRPDLLYVMGLLSRFQSDPRIPHWNASKESCDTYWEPSTTHCITEVQFCVFRAIQMLIGLQT